MEEHHNKRVDQDVSMQSIGTSETVGDTDLVMPGAFEGLVNVSQTLPSNAVQTTPADRFQTPPNNFANTSVQVPLPNTSQTTPSRVSQTSLSNVFRRRAHNGKNLKSTVQNAEPVLVSPGHTARPLQRSNAFVFQTPPPDAIVKPTLNTPQTLSSDPSQTNAHSDDFLPSMVQDAEPVLAPPNDAGQLLQSDEFKLDVPTSSTKRKLAEYAYSRAQSSSSRHLSRPGTGLGVQRSSEKVIVVERGSSADIRDMQRKIEDYSGLSKTADRYHEENKELSEKLLLADNDRALAIDRADKLEMKLREAVQAQQVAQAEIAAMRDKYIQADNAMNRLQEEKEMLEHTIQKLKEEADRKLEGFLKERDAGEEARKSSEAGLHSARKDLQIVTEERNTAVQRASDLEIQLSRTQNEHDIARKEEESERMKLKGELAEARDIIGTLEKSSQEHEVTRKEEESERMKLKGKLAEARDVIGTLEKSSQEREVARKEEESERMKLKGELAEARDIIGTLEKSSQEREVIEAAKKTTDEERERRLAEQNEVNIGLQQEIAALEQEKLDASQTVLAQKAELQHFRQLLEEAEKREIELTSRLQRTVDKLEAKNLSMEELEAGKTERVRIQQEMRNVERELQESKARERGLMEQMDRELRIAHEERDNAKRGQEDQTTQINHLNALLQQLDSRNKMLEETNKKTAEQLEARQRKEHDLETHHKQALEKVERTMRNKVEQLKAEHEQNISDHISRARTEWNEQQQRIQKDLHNEFQQELDQRKERIEMQEGCIKELERKLAESLANKAQDDSGEEMGMDCDGYNLSDKAREKMPEPIPRINLARKWPQKRDLRMPTSNCDMVPPVRFKKSKATGKPLSERLGNSRAGRTTDSRGSRAGTPFDVPARTSGNTSVRWGPGDDTPDSSSNRENRSPTPRPPDSYQTSSSRGLYMQDRSPTPMPPRFGAKSSTSAANNNNGTAGPSSHASSSAINSASPSSASPTKRPTKTPNTATPKKSTAGPSSTANPGSSVSAPENDASNAGPSLNDDVLNLMRDIRDALHGLGSESKTPKRPRMLRSMFKQSGRLYKPRDPNRQCMLTRAHKEMNELMKIKRDDELIGVAENIIVGPEEVEEYLNNNIDAPTLDPFRLYLDEPNSPWNIHVAKQFAAMLFEKHPDLPSTEDEVMEYFLVRLETLKKKLAESLRRQVRDDGEEETEEDAAKRRAAEAGMKRNRNRKRERRAALLEKRLEICAAEAAAGNEHWDRLQTMVVSLGTDGQSSDESDNEEYSVTIKPWRNQKIVELLKVIDGNRRTTNCYGNPLPGARRRNRIRRRNPTFSQAPAVAGLPINFYDEAWYDKLTEAERDCLDATEEEVLPEVCTDDA